jgi:hypothetical protein
LAFTFLPIIKSDTPVLKDFVPGREDSFSGIVLDGEFMRSGSDAEKAYPTGLNNILPGTRTESLRSGGIVFSQKKKSAR